MQERDKIEPNAKAYNSVVVACASVGDMERAFQVAVTMRAAGIRLNVVTYNNLIEACCNAGRIERAFALAKEMIQVHEVTPNSHTYNTLIRGCGQWGQLDAALRVLTSMRSAGVAPTVITYSVAVAACARTGGAIALEWAFDLLRDMRADGVQTNIVTYNSLIHACARAARADRAFHILDAMRQERITPDMVTLCSLVDACGRSGMLDRAFATITELPKEFPTLRPSVAAYNALLYASAKAGNLERLSHAYRELHRVGLKPNVVTYSTLIAAYASVNDMERAMSTLSRMKRRNLRPNYLTFTSIIAGHGRLGQVEEALAMFEEARATCGEPDEELYTAAIVAVVEGGGREETAMDLAESMKGRGFDLPKVLNRMMLRAGGLERTGDELSALLSAMEALGIRPTRAACESVVSAYAAEGNVSASFDVLQAMNRLRYPPNLRTYKKLIECCGLAADLPRAQRLFGAIRGEGEAPRRSGQFRTHHWIELYEVMLRAIVRAGDADMATTYLGNMGKDCGHLAAEAAEDRILNRTLANRAMDSCG
jgi:pentatricopeptide repeat protein